MPIALDILILVLLYTLCMRVVHHIHAKRSNGRFTAFRTIELLWAMAITTPILYFIFYSVDNDFRDSFWISLLFAVSTMTAADILSEKYPTKCSCGEKHN